MTITLEKGTVATPAESTSSIVVTGVGMVTAQGLRTDECWSSLLNGDCGITMNITFDDSGTTIPCAGVAPVPDCDSIDRCYLLGSRAMREALEMSGVDLDSVDRDRVGLVVGSSLGAMPTLEATHRRAIESDILAAGAAASSQLHCVADQLATEFDLRGPRIVTSNACAAGAVAIGYAAELLWSDDVDLVVCGGVDPLAQISANGFTCLGALDEQPCSPMAGSSGLTLGEGAGFMVLEKADVAAAREQEVMAQIAGYGTSCDGYHQTAPDPGGKGAYNSMDAALRSAQLKPGDVSYVNLHGTGTPTNDAVEPKAIRSLFKNIDLPPVSSVKGAIGHTLGAAGAIEAVCSIKAVHDGVLPPTINNRDQASRTGLDIVAKHARPANPEAVISNSFAFGGNNASIVITKPGRNSVHVEPVPVREVGISGIAALAGAAGNSEELLSALATGSPVWRTNEKSWEGEDLQSGKVDVEALSRGLNPSKVRRMDPLGIISCATVNDLHDSYGKLSRKESEGTGIIFATGYGPVTAVTQFNDGIIRQGPDGANALLFPNTVVNAAAGHLAMLNRYRGYTATLACGGTSSIMALQLAARVIGRGAADRIMVVVADEFPSIAVQTVTKLPGYRHRVDGPGAVLSEGAVCVLVEAVDTAEARGASAIATLRGFGARGESVGIGRSAPDGRAWAKAMTAALDQAHLDSSKAATVVSAAGGHRRVDRAERAARQLAGLSSTPTIYPKSVVGETFGSAAGIGLFAALRGSSPAPGDVIVVNAFSHGGGYASMVVQAR
ncbi:3-oxoacyl-ACP synthase [Cutibacterium sp. WCA-380-WT-3A]|uniref:3-oxoacyl-ACP synthase n=1 Tax=Cutibacterium porci TaxID=2605781 RepID=A0A7K0J453_9ACTN|nr:beta-ketoacyl-[acyl-carrier-protein] synthase family protein [Cutibacterium porci]MSS44618.1 3-oxoacyl-ACP synthase [Cutibacterium porci]